MGMVTRCPACSTLFRVTPLQLQAHRGQVRCGVCHHVFDGFRALEAEPEQPAAMPAASPDHDPADEATHDLPEIVLPESVPALTPFIDVVPPGRPQIPKPYSWTPRLAEVKPVTESTPVPAEPPVMAADPVHESLPEEPVQVTASVVPATVPADSPADAEGESEVEGSPVGATARLSGDGAITDDPPYEAPAETARRRRWPWALASMLLFTVAAAQGLQQFGAEIAARQPALRPVLVRACGLVTCNLALPQRPKLINIEASDLQAVDPSRPGLIQLTATLRNHAGYDVAYPSMDLVLTNTRDHTLARRIFVPREYLAKGADISTGIPASAEFTVRLDLDTGDLAASGFRLDLLPAPAE